MKSKIQGISILILVSFIFLVGSTMDYQDAVMMEKYHAEMQGRSNG